MEDTLKAARRCPHPTDADTKIQQASQISKYPNRQLPFQPGFWQTIKLAKSKSKFTNLCV